MKRGRWFRAALGLPVLGLSLAGFPPIGTPPAEASPQPPQLWLLSRAGEPQPLTRNARVQNSGHYSFSPDASAVAFVHLDGLAVVQVHTGETTVIESEHNFYPDAVRWSPVGDEIAYRDGGGLGIVSVDGTSQRPLVAGDHLSAPETLEWSPDGGTLAFTTSGDAGSDQTQLELIDADGTDRRVLTSPAGATLDWSPDGRTIVFDRNGDIYRISTSGGPAEALTSGRTEDARPRWSPDGSTIAFSRPYGIWRMSADGSGQTKLATARQEGPKDLDWSPQSDEIVYSDFLDLYSVTPSGFRRQLTSGVSPHDRAPSWTPTGEAVGFIRSYGGQIFGDVDAELRGHLRVVGRITSAIDVCDGSLPLRVERRTPTGWITVRRARSDSSGRFAITLPDRRGTYRVRQRPVLIETASVFAECRSYPSGQLIHRH